MRTNLQPLRLRPSSVYRVYPDSRQPVLVAVHQNDSDARRDAAERNRTCRPLVSGEYVWTDVIWTDRDGVPHYA